MFLTNVYMLCFPGAAQCALGEKVDYTPAWIPVGILLVAVVIGLVVGLAQRRQQ
ncbi:hypothetical protein [Microbacterium rhizosphaerae]|uniref:LPXTG cell wall anchor domain-containing protein n=1 Tax=Microbacterium rhizosphaerae TaxID=1678237 RepID=A0ABZ0SL86_9MICO|nr:hypothetical protein [Microbacterium rhizosphaerae]WPR90162.1 hypothetical protein SM116_02420 [Microbacterium rhizosphaerae]